jgi:glucokinase
MSENDQLVIGIDIGGTGTKFGIVDTDGNVLFSGNTSTKKHPTVETFIDELYEELSVLINKAGGPSRIKGIGIGAPNGNFYTGNIEYAANLVWQGIVPLSKLVKAKFKLPVVVTNDANAAAIGEMMYGAAKGMKDFIMITLGTGVGSGIVANGQLIYGHDGFAGELGHTIIIPDGRLHAGTGKKGSLESYASATGVMLTAKEMLDKSKEPSLLRDVPKDKLDSKAVYDAALEGDKIALEIFEFTGKILGLALANAVMFSSPEAIILFGGLTKSGEFILKPTRKYMEENLIRIFQGKVKILVSHLKESDAAILGASALAWG